LKKLLIAHRGNTTGPELHLENTQGHIDRAIYLGFDVEIDLWGFGGGAHLGHDGPESQIDLEWLLKRGERLWIHCKNFQAISLIRSSSLHWFFHESDPYTLTSRGFIWTFPGNEVPAGKSVGLWFEEGNPIHRDMFESAAAICGDHVGLWSYAL